MQIQQTRNMKFDFMDIGLFLFPILPQYIYLISGINLVNALTALMLIYCIILMKFKRIKMRQYIVLFWMYMVFYAIRYLMDGEWMRSITHFISFILVPYMVICITDTPKKFFKAVDILINADMVMGLIGIVEAISKVNIFQLFAPEGTWFFHDIRYGLLRVMTTFGQPIAYGLYQLFIVALVSYRQSTNIGISKMKFLKFVKIIAIINVVLSVSRGAIFSLIALMVMLAYNRNKRKFYVTIITIIGIFIIATMIYNVSNMSIPFIDDVISIINQLLFGQSSNAGSGIGDRMNLSEWVFEVMDDNYIWGMGTTAEFVYQVYDWQVKTSIENQYLCVMYNLGLVGMVLLILSYLNVLMYSFKNNKKNGSILNEKISFNKVAGILLLIYFIELLSVQETDMTRMYVIMIALIISYNRLRKTIDTTVNIEEG